MVLEMKFDSLEELTQLQHLAAHADQPVYLGNEDDSIRADARSFLGLMALDYTAPVRVITDSFYVIRQLENRLRRQDAAARS